MIIPCLFITYNRLEYTKKALDSLLQSDVKEIFIWDNNSTDGTVEYLMQIAGNTKIKNCCFNYKNEGIRVPMNWFIANTIPYEFIMKVDNDTLIPKDFCTKMVPYMEYCDIVQAKHHIIAATNPGGWNAFIKPMRQYKGLRFNNFVGGSGILIRRSVLSELPETDWLLYSWVTWQKQNPKVRKAFAEEVEIKLLDDHGYDDYPSYYRETKRI